MSEAAGDGFVEYLRKTDANPRAAADTGMHTGWIGVDLDGTLAIYDGWKGPTHIGEPVPEMLFRVRKWLADGREVRILTARASHDGTFERMVEVDQAVAAINAWCMQHFGRRLPVTCIKDYGMIELWDDRAVQVEANTGRLIGRSTRGLS